MPGLEIFYLAVFVVGFIASGALVVWDRRRRRARGVEAPLDNPEIEAFASRTSRATGSMPTRATPTELPAVVVDDLPTTPPIAQVLFAPGGRGGDHRECPTCKRRFGETLGICPFDSTPLRSLHPRVKRTTRPAITGRRRPTCTSCGRRFESAAKFCYHDGGSLTTESLAEVPVMRVCRSCGWETPARDGTCGCDEPHVIEIDPSRASVQLPTIPMMQCRRCGTLAPPGTIECVNDGELLYPVMNVELNALPPTGIGPRRRMCGQCGRQFSKGAHYCSYDGTRLSDLN